jgi:Zn-dependent protease with chaperone function
MAEQGEAIYFDGVSNRKHKVVIRFGPALEIVIDGVLAATWGYGEVRRVDSARGTLRLMCLSAPSLARIEIHDDPLAHEVESRCPALQATAGDQRQTLRIVLYSAAALVSFAGLLFYGIPLLAERLTPLIPYSFERRLGEAVDKQVHSIFGDKICTEPAGRAALARLVERLQSAAHLTEAFDVQVLQTAVPNAFALPGGRIYVSGGLLAQAKNPDEIAGVIAHELGHLHHRDSLRRLIQDGGTGFLFGILFGDVLGGSAIIFASRSLISGSYSRDAERGADAFSIDVMHQLGRSTKPLGELLVRISRPEVEKTLSILSSHPLTTERLKMMEQADQPAAGPALISADDWSVLKAICR